MACVRKSLNVADVFYLFHSHTHTFHLLLLYVYPWYSQFCLSQSLIFRFTFAGIIAWSIFRKIINLWMLEVLSRFYISALSPSLWLLSGRPLLRLFLQIMNVFFSGHLVLRLTFPASLLDAYLRVKRNIGNCGRHNNTHTHFVNGWIRNNDSNDRNRIPTTWQSFK